VKKFWSALAKLLVKGALFAAEHPDEVINVVKSVKK
jgi:hypothetical protein